MSILAQSIYNSTGFTIGRRDSWTEFCNQTQSSKKKLKMQSMEENGVSDVGNIVTMVTNLRCWWQNHYVGDFFRDICDFSVY